MSKVSIQGDQNGTGDFTIKAPNGNTDRTLTLPDEVGKFLTDSGAINVDPSAPTQSAMIDSSGSLLVGKTSSGLGNVGFEAGQSGFLGVTAQDVMPQALNRLGSDGDILEFRKDGSTVGDISVFNSDNLVIGTSNVGGTSFLFTPTADKILPRDGDGGKRDGVISLGDPNDRFEDIYATNGTIQTSDVNEKQNVEKLTNAEARVAAKAKTLLRKYRWKSAVEEKGDEARVHFGITAQDLEQAFIDEGLDAGRYGMFIRGEWYEAEVEKTRTVENDDGTETTETYMATETYDSAEEAPADAVHKERLGVRYHELLAFIIAAI